MSHAAMDKQCAMTLRAWLEQCFPGFIEIFVSSHWESIAMGEEWLEEVTKSLKRCSVGIVLASTNSLSRNWVSFEVGAMKLVGKKIIPVCIGSLKASDLPAPLDRSQACEYNDVEHRWNLLRAIAKYVGLPLEYTSMKIPAADVDNAPAIRPVESPPSRAQAPQRTGHGVALERLFPTKDRWTTVVYTCRATFTNETCPGRGSPLRKTLSPHVPVDEWQTLSTALNHFTPAATGKHEDDVLHTVMCSFEAERLALDFREVLPGDVPPLLDRDLVVIGENNFSTLLLQLAEPFQPWTGKQREEAVNPKKPGRSMVYAMLTPHARLGVSGGQVKNVGLGGGMISVFPNPLNTRRSVLNVYGCHREGQVTLENWMRGAEVETIVDAIAKLRGDEDPRLFSTQIVVDRGGQPNPGHFVDPNLSSEAIANVSEGRPFWLTRVSTFQPAERVAVNADCDAQPPMYDISLVVELDADTQQRIRRELDPYLPATDLYLEDEQCNIGFHITLFEFCTHDLPSAELLKELEGALDTLVAVLGDDRGAERPARCDAQIRGIELAHAALVAYVDFLPADRREMNWLETVRTWCDAAVRRMTRENAEMDRLLNKRRIPFPPHVTLCRFGKPVTPQVEKQILEMTARRRYAVLAPVSIDRLRLATATRRPYQDVRWRELYEL